MSAGITIDERRLRAAHRECGHIVRARFYASVPFEGDHLAHGRRYDETMRRALVETADARVAVLQRMVERVYSRAAAADAKRTRKAARRLEALVRVR